MSDCFLVLPKRFKAHLTNAEIAALPRIIASTMNGFSFSEFAAASPFIVTGASTKQAKALHKHNSVVGVNLNAEFR